MAFGLLVLAACARTPPQPAEPDSQVPADFPAASYKASETGNGRVFRVDPEDSEIRIYVFRAGALAGLGHNHIVSGHALNGFIFLAEDVQDSRFDLYVPVHRLEVDKPQLRAAAGEDFAPSAEDVEKTRNNMLGPDALDAGRFPFIRLRGHVHGGTPEKPVMEIELTLRHATRTLPIQPQLSLEEGKLTAGGELSVLQRDFGITPFSALGGALQVGDELRLRYRIVTVAIPGSSSRLPPR